MDITKDAYRKVIEYELSDSTYPVHENTEQVVRDIIYQEGFLCCVVIPSKYSIINRSIAGDVDHPHFMQIQEIEVRIKEIVSACFDSGHLSIIFGLRSPVSQQLHFGYNQAAVHDIHFFGGSQSPLDSSQKQDFFECLARLKLAQCNRAICFSHDSEYLYEIWLE